VTKEEYEDPKSGYMIDVRMEGKHFGSDVVWAVEVDGPSHFSQVLTTPSLVESQKIPQIRYHLYGSTGLQELKQAFAQGTEGRLPSGSTLLKRRQLGQLGYEVVSVPYWEWIALRGDKDLEQTYLRNLLSRGGVGIATQN
jgi:hypothetical protein